MNYNLVTQNNIIFLVVYEIMSTKHEVSTKCPLSCSYQFVVRDQHFYNEIATLPVQSMWEI